MSPRSHPQSDDRGPASLPFPAHARRNAAKPRPQAQTHDEMMEAFATVSRRINDLARELKCLGYFDENPDRPRAA